MKARLSNNTRLDNYGRNRSAKRCVAYPGRTVGTPRIQHARSAVAQRTNGKQTGVIDTPFARAQLVPSRSERRISSRGGVCRRVCCQCGGMRRCGLGSWSSGNNRLARSFFRAAFRVYRKNLHGKEARHQNDRKKNARARTRRRVNRRGLLFHGVPSQRYCFYRFAV